MSYSSKRPLTSLSFKGLLRPPLPDHALVNGQNAPQYPVRVQACLVGFFISSTFTSYWTILTFLLAGASMGEPFSVRDQTALVLWL